MESWVTWVLAGVGAIILGMGAWWLLQPAPPDSGESIGEWTVLGANPVRIGTTADPYDYAGNAVQTVSGTVTLRVAVDLSEVALEAAVALEADAGIEGLRPAGRPIENVAWSASGSPLQVWEDTTIHGTTGRGDTALPSIHARWAGVSSVSLQIDGVDVPGTTVLWSVADALRRSDGAVRQQGLVYSPLLRDKSGFSDPTQIELTMWLRSAEGVLLQFVFRDMSVSGPSDLMIDP